MLLFLLSAMGLVMVASQSTIGPGSVPIRSAPAQEVQYSLLYNLLQISGYSETCVSNALETCSAGTGRIRSPSLIQVRVSTNSPSLSVEDQSALG